MRFTLLPSSALRLTGTDRLDFVQGQMTNDLKKAGVPGMVAACFLTTRGQIEFFSRVYRRADDVYLHLAPGEAPALAARLRKYIIFDQVEVHDLSDTLASLHVWEEHLPGWDMAGADVQELTVANTSVLAARVNRTGRVGLDVHVLSRALDGVLSELGGEEASVADLERARIEAGLPDVSADRWQGSLLQEVGFEHLVPSISYRKGCYVGQEIMARLEARGNARFRLAALGGADLPAHSEVTRGSKAVGVTGASTGSRALVKLRKEVVAGDVVEVGGVSAEVMDVPATAAAR